MNIIQEPSSNLESKKFRSLKAIQLITTGVTFSRNAPSQVFLNSESFGTATKEVKFASGGSLYNYKKTSQIVIGQISYNLN
jgi:hypothetical protein